ncbi:MAG: DarT ssDNA thymidine ADP-ribosyltransferase family protein [Acidimicrobiaceae bacterium]|nr:DarT ssDNA thymidine ADP-ribosyltransferase family protein [Acidimicrobiaceae bacterium]
MSRLREDGLLASAGEALIPDLFHELLGVWRRRAVALVASPGTGVQEARRLILGLGEPENRRAGMAEFLVHGHVPWSAFIGVAACNDDKCQQVEHALASVGAKVLVTPRPEWYF